MEEIDSIKPLENINIAEVCRACFETCEQYKILFDEAESIDKRTLGDVFFDVVKIEMKANAETPPSRICLACSNDLISAYNFIQKSQKNNGRLLQYLENANIKKTDCLTEFPMDIPNDHNATDFLQIKVENEAINDYDYNESIPDDDRPDIINDSDESDYEPLVNKKEKIKRSKLQCIYCNRIFKRQDFYENHMRKHKEDDVKKKEIVESEDGEKLESEDNTTSFLKEPFSGVKLDTDLNTCNVLKENPNLGKVIFTTMETKEKKSSVKANVHFDLLSNQANEFEETISKTVPNFATGNESNTESQPPAQECLSENADSKSKRMSYQKILLDQKKSFVKLYEEGKTIKEAAAMTNINLNTAKGVLRNYKERNDVIDKRRGGNRSRKLTNDVLSSIEKCVEKHPGIQLEQIRKILAEKNVHLSKSSIRNGLQELKITMHLPSYDLDQVNMPQAIEHRRIFALEFSEWGLHERHKIVFIDECVFSLQLGMAQTASSTTTVRGRKAVVIAALNSNGIIHSNIFGKGSCSTTGFASFLRELVEIISLQDEMAGALLIMDSAGIHVSREVGEILAGSKFSTRTLPPFSPMLNPLRKSFEKTKTYARALLNESNIGETNLVEVMKYSVAKITPTDCCNNVMDAVLLLHDAIAGRPFQC